MGFRCGETEHPQLHFVLFHEFLAYQRFARIVYLRLRTVIFVPSGRFVPAFVGQMRAHLPVSAMTEAPERAEDTNTGGNTQAFFVFPPSL